MNDFDTDDKMDRLINTVGSISDRLHSKEKEETKEEDFLDKEFEEVPINKINLDDGLIEVINQRIIEIQKGIRFSNPLSVIFLCGSSLEGILLGVASNYPELLKP